MNTPRDNADALAMCLQAIEEGRATLEECVAAFPEHAAELRALLRMADDLSRVTKPVMPADHVAALGATLQQATAITRKPRATRRRLSPRRSLVRWVSVVGLVLAMILVSGAGTILAASSALPGEMLYPVKRMGEETRLRLASQEQRAALLVGFARERVEEVEALAAMGQPLDPAVVGDLLAASDLALQTLEDATDGASPELAQQLVVLSARQETVLTDLLSDAPPAAQNGLERAVEASQQGQRRAQAVLAGAQDEGQSDQDDIDGGEGESDNGNNAGGNGQGPPCEQPPCSENGKGVGPSNSGGKGGGSGG